MKRGFTIVELLVASVLLGLLVTILTMVFNQSSIAWRTGVAGMTDMDKVRENISELREEADNAFVHNGKVHRILGLWDEDGNLRRRACDADDEDKDENKALMIGGSGRTGNGKWIENLSNLKTDGFKAASVGDGSAKSAKTYIVNVMSGGPKNDINDWEAIWSFPDDFD